jgi:hypothetical protein
LRIEYPRTLRDLLALLFGQYQLRVDLTTADGTPVAEQPVTVSTWRGELCHATTDGAGVAECAVPSRDAGDVLSGLVYAQFAGSADYLGSNAGTPPPTRHHGRGGFGWLGSWASWAR